MHKLQDDIVQVTNVKKRLDIAEEMMQLKQLIENLIQSPSFITFYVLGISGE
ncbi:hypothetical protein [Staphylococcus aureus]|uniref:hypothetical protein n=1 Tax=Staphylococcus aureus TaxID=1280 RepID=UPI00351F25D2